MLAELGVTRTLPLNFHDFFAVREAAYGPERRFAAAQPGARNGGEADCRRGAECSQLSCSDPAPKTPYRHAPMCYV